MATSGQLTLAKEYLALWNLPAAAVSLDPEEIAREILARKEQYLQPHVAREHIVFVDTDKGVLMAR
jgi:hypothetical protein